MTYLHLSRPIRRKHLLGVLSVPLMVVFGLCSGPVKGASFNWDGGSNTWDAGTTAWWNGGNVWTNSFNNLASFGGLSGIVTLGDPISAGGLTFNSTGYTLTGNILTLGPLTGATSPIIATNGFNTRATIGSVLSGTSGFTKTGNGTLTLSNNANNFSGDISIKGGSVVITDASQLGTGTTAISITGVANTGSPGYSGGTL